MSKFDVIIGDCRRTVRGIAANSVDTIITSPPYFNLRDYGNDLQIGREKQLDDYIASLVSVFNRAKRALKPDGTLWINIGDSYGKGKQLLGVPWKLAFALQASGWILRQDIIWSKPNPMPESVKDRCTRAHEYIFLFSKSEKYYFDYNAIKEPAISAPRKREKNNGESAVDTKLRGNSGCCGVTSEFRNKRDVWGVSTKSYPGAHFATFPPDLIIPCVMAGSRKGGVVLDVFGGSGTTAGVANALGRDAIICELNEDYAALIPDRVKSIIAKYGNRNE